MTAFQRVRLSADKSELFVMATSGATSALAAVPIETDPTLAPSGSRPGMGRSRSTCRQYGAAHPAGVPVREANADGEYDVVQLDMTPDAIMISDASGLFVEILGQALRVSACPTERLPQPARCPGESPWRRWGIADRQAFGVHRRDVRPVQPRGHRLPHAPHVTRGPDPRESRGFIVWCGPSFIGHVSSQHKRRQLARQAGRLPPQAHGAPRAAVGVELV